MQTGTWGGLLVCLSSEQWSSNPVVSSARCLIHILRRSALLQGNCEIIDFHRSQVVVAAFDVLL